MSAGVGRARVRQFLTEMAAEASGEMAGLAQMGMAMGLLDRVLEMVPEDDATFDQLVEQMAGALLTLRVGQPLVVDDAHELPPEGGGGPADAPAAAAEPSSVEDDAP